MKRLEIFRPGKHVASNGETFTFTEADLKATAAAYDPAKHEAPLVVGHPKSDDPAYGWTKALAFSDTLQAEPDQVDPAFAEMVGAGRFKKISASFYAPDAPGNPVPGVYYLRHIGFLGAQPPAVKGLKNASFAAADAGVIEFADWDDMQIAGLFRALREWIIGKFGLEEADKVVPGWTVDNLQVSAAQETAAEATASLGTQYSEEENTVDKVEAERLAAENAQLKNQAAAFAERETALKAQEAAQRSVALIGFCGGLVAAGKMLPVHKDGMVSFMAALDAAQVIEFGEGEQKVSKPGADWLREYLDAQPKIVDFKEHAGGAAAEALTDPTAIAQKAVEFQEAERKAGRNVNTAEAVAHVTNNAAK